MIDLKLLNYESVKNCSFMGYKKKSESIYKIIQNNLASEGSHHCLVKQHSYSFTILMSSAR